MTQPSHLRPVDSPDSGDPGKDAPRSPQRTRAGRALPTDRMKMDLQVKVLNAIGRLSSAGKRPVNADELSKALNGLAPTTVILSNRFFADAGWITNQRGQYAATDALVEYGRRHAVDAPGHVSEAAMEALREPVRRQSWFWEALHPYLANGKLPFTDAVIILMREANASDSHMPMIMNLITWLGLIGLVEVEDDHLRLPERESAADGQDQAAPAASDGHQPGAPAVPLRPAASATGTTSEKPTAQQGGNPPAYVIAFDFGVRMTAEDLARLTPEQIKAFFESIGTVMALGNAKG